tara:strand:- start:83 stop:340 length:258 start_codon:yes stop_codon:yes gene_type:complete
MLTDTIMQTSQNKNTRMFLEEPRVTLTPLSMNDITLDSFQELLPPWLNTKEILEKLLSKPLLLKSTQPTPRRSDEGPTCMTFLIQ